MGWLGVGGWASGASVVVTRGTQGDMTPCLRQQVEISRLKDEYNLCSTCLYYQGMDQSPTQIFRQGLRKSSAVSGKAGRLTQDVRGEIGL